MPLALIKYRDNNQFIYIWNLNPENEFDFTFDDFSSINQEYTRVKNKKILQQRIAVLHMLKLHYGKTVEIMKDSFGKPHLIDCKDFISISHCNHLIAIQISESEDIGIDLEIISPRIAKILNKFLDTETIENELKPNDFAKMMVMWGAKEAVYKWHGVGNLPFTENIILHPFKMSDTGRVHAHVIRGEDIVDIVLNYEVIDEFVLVFVEEIFGKLKV